MRRVWLATLIFYSTGCSGLIQKVSAPSPVYKVDPEDKKSKKELGDAPQWTGVRDDVQEVAHSCQLLLLKESNAINKSNRTEVGLAVAGGVIAIASGTSSTILGVTADQDNNGISVATWSTAALAAAGGIVSLVSNIKQKASTSTFESRREVWDEGFEAIDSDPNAAKERFRHCQTAKPTPKKKPQPVPEQVVDLPSPRRIARRLNPHHSLEAPTENPPSGDTARLSLTQLRGPQL